MTQPSGECSWLAGFNYCVLLYGSTCLGVWLPCAYVRRRSAMRGAAGSRCLAWVGLGSSCCGSWEHPVRWSAIQNQSCEGGAQG